MTAILSLKNVSRNFGGIKAVSNVSFDLAEAEVVALIGPNGAGKTTLVNLITGVHPASSGEVHFKSQNVTRQKPFQAARRGMARTFQIVQPFPRMSVLENVAASALFGGTCEGIAEAREKARKELDFVGLGHVLDTSASSLTLPGRKRLELAKSLAMDPSILFLDEVNAGLNATEIDGALDLIRAIAARGVSILIIEHLMKVVLSVSRRVLVLHHGELIAQGTPGEMVQNDQVIEAYLGAKFAERFKMEGHHA